MAAGKRTSQLEMLENPMLKVVSFLGHKNIIATAIPMLSGLTFPMAITFMTLGVAVTPK